MRHSSRSEQRREQQQARHRRASIARSEATCALAAGAGREHLSLLAQADFFGAGLSQQAGRPHDEDDDEDDEPDRLLQRGIEIEAREALHQADDEPADIGARDAAEPAEHDDREGRAR